MRTLARRWRHLPAVDLLTDRETTGFLALSAMVGVGVGIGAAALVLVIDGISAGFDSLADLAGGRRWWVLIAVPLGFVGSWWIAHRLAPEVEGDGVPDVIAALAVRDGRIPGRVAPIKIVATALTLGGGGSGGREGPIVQIGGAVGSVISRFFHLGPDQIRSLVAAGAGAGIGASFNAPITGMLFAMEVILGSFAVRHLSAIVIASVVAAITSRSIVGEGLSVRAASYSLEDPRQLVVFLLLSAIAAFAGLALLRGVDVLDRWGRARPHLRGWRPVAFGLVVGAIGLMEPAVLGTGQGFLSRLLAESEMVERAGIGGTAWWALIVVAIAKLVATVFTATSGGAGGAFFPSLFIGASLGAGLGRFLEPFWTFGSLKPGSLAVVGMATVIAAVARAPLTAMMIAFEITGARDYGLVLPLMLGTVMATFIADRFHTDSLYTATLRRRGINVAPHSELDLLDTVSVGDVMHHPRATAFADQPLVEAHEAMSHYRYNGLVVLQDGKVAGVVTLADVIRAGRSIDSVLVSQAMTARPVTVTPSTPVSHALERLASLGVGRLPVVAEDGSGRFVGLFRREEAVRAYHRALGNRTDRELGRRRLDQRTDPGVGYYDFRIPPGSMAEGRAVRDVAWPEGSTLVSVRRDREVLIPSGATSLLAGDVITAFGTPSSRNEMIERLNAGADEPTAELSLEDIRESDG